MITGRCRPPRRSRSAPAASPRCSPGTPLPTLRRAGLAAGGDPATDDALDCAFAGTAFLLDYF